MRQPSARQAPFKEHLGIISLLLVSVFVTELAIMELFSPLFDRLNPAAAALLDATLIILLLGAPFWFLLIKHLAGPASSSGASRLSAVSLFIKAMIGVFLAEYLVMLMLPCLVPDGATHTRGLLDAFLSAMATSIPLWYVVSRAEVHSRDIQVLESPLRLYTLLLSTVFLSDLLQEFLKPLHMGGGIAPGKVIDAMVTTACGAPLLYLLVVRPLRRAARVEKTRVAAVHSQVIDAIVAIDTNGVICSFNPAAEEIFGYTAGEMIGASAALLLEKGRRSLDTLMARASRRARDHRPFTYGEFSCRRRDGMSLVMHVSISEVLLEQRAEYLLIMRDVTSRNRMQEALRESEMRFKEIFHQSEDAILFFKPGSAVIIDANATAATIFGYRKDELMSGGLEQMVAPADLPALVETISGIAEGRGANKDFSCRRRDGHGMVVSLRGKIMLLDGVPVTYCTFRDITERVRMQEKSRELQAKLIQTNKMTSLGLLVSGVAHEINNPNNFIMANTELLGRMSRETLTALHELSEEQADREEMQIAGIPLSQLDEHWIRLVQGIADGSRRVNDIVKNLKGFARQERNQELSEVDVNQVARSAISLLHHELIKYTDNFHFEPAEALPPVKGHGQQLGQVIINLLMNACQALPGKNSGIWLSTGFLRDEGAVTIAVRDEGHGIMPDETRRIMEPFFTTKLSQGGTGLGLSISESIVKEHGGVLYFTSHPEGGTTFSVRIPVKA